MVSLFLFPTGLTALDSEPRGRRYAKNTGHNRNRLYSMAIHCPASMEMHYFQWILLKSVYEDTSKIRDTTGTLFIQGPSIALLVWRSIMFNGSFLRVCRILRFVKKFDFAFLSLGGASHGARVWCLGRVPKHRNHWQEVEGSGKK